MNRSEFLKLLKEGLPGLRRPINQQDGLLHFEVGELRKFAQRAIFDGDRSSLETCFRLAEEAYANGDKRLKDAIDVAFVEELNFVTPHSSYYWAWEAMPNRLKRLYENFHGRDRIPQPRA